MPLRTSSPAAIHRTLIKAEAVASATMRDLALQRATFSKAHALPRGLRRQAEHYEGEVTRCTAQLRDLKRAERVGTRIGQVIQHVLNDLQKIRQHLVSYTFTSTVGKDSDASGVCQNDLSGAIDLRQAWKEELKALVTLLMEYIEAQFVGSYAIGHTVNVSSACPGMPSTCCRKVYRSVLHYMTPSGDCLQLPIASSSGSADAVQPSEDTGSVSASPTAENIAATSASYNHRVLTNPDFGIYELHQRVVVKDVQAWLDHVVKAFTTIMSTDYYLVTLRAEDEALSVSLGIDITLYPELVKNTKRREHIEHELQSRYAFEKHIIDLLFYGVDDDDDLVAYTNTFDVTSMATVVEEAMHIDNIEDEPDLCYIIRKVSDLTHLARRSQSINDREMRQIEHVRDTTETNRSFYHDQMQDIVGVDGSEVVERMKVGNSVCANLQSIRLDVGVSKREFYR